MYIFELGALINVLSTGNHTPYSTRGVSVGRGPEGVCVHTYGYQRLQVSHQRTRAGTRLIECSGALLQVELTF
jgi:hypothetical protein